MNTKDVEEMKKVAIEALNLVRLYCQTTEASGYTEYEMNLLRSEFEPILSECDKTIRQLQGNRE